MLTLNKKESEDLMLALEKSYRMLSEEGFNEKSMKLIVNGRNMLRKRLNVQRIKCDIPSDVKVIYKEI